MRVVLESAQEQLMKYLMTTTDATSPAPGHPKAGSTPSRSGLMYSAGRG